MASQPMRMQRDLIRGVEERESVRLGTMVGIDPQGRPLVTFKGGPAMPVPARVATSDPRPADADLLAGVAVLLMFENGDSRQPIVVGFVRDALSMKTPVDRVAVVAEKMRTVELNGKALVFEGQEEIVLRCGLGSLTIRANGQIIVKGTRLVSRASETNKIRGASVQIN